MQPGFFDLEDRYALLEELGDPLPKINEVVDFEAFRATLESTYEVPDPGKGGRPRTDAVLMFKVLFLQQLYNLSDDQTEYQIRDRYSFARFLGLGPEGRVPDAKTIWLHREQLNEAGVLEVLFAELMAQIEAAGYHSRKGQIVDAAMVEAPRSRNRRDENERIRRGEVPEDWEEAKRRQKDTQARWARKEGKTYFGYKNHINVDVKYKLIRRFGVSDAALNDRRMLEGLLDETNSSRALWADANYRSREWEARLREYGYRSHIQRQGHASRPLTEREKRANHRRSKTRIRVEHVFAQQRWMGRTVRTIGLERARFKIGMMNFVYNVRRLAWLTVHSPPKGSAVPG
ncbi:IS5 family transposase [Lentisalinibacter sediminis]|uniref:IS5 family transposase n=1 Tax=Lentisalinibacter sediminis TaxID=2992237 RepID=UPI00386D7189